MEKEQLQGTDLPSHILEDSSQTTTFFQWQLKKGCICKNLKSTFHMMCSASGLPPPHSSQRE